MYAVHWYDRKGRLQELRVVTGCMLCDRGILIEREHFKPNTTPSSRHTVEQCHGTTPPGHWAKKRLNGVSLRIHHVFVVVVGDETLSEKCLIRVRVTRNSCYSSNTALRVTTRDLGRRLTRIRRSYVTPHGAK